MVWILTQEYNDHAQHGEYFIACFLEKPTQDQLLDHDVNPGEIPHVLNGGGRVKWESSWFYLREYRL